MAIAVELPQQVPNGIKNIRSAPNGVKNVHDIKNKEIHNNPNLVHVDFSEFYGIEPTHVDRRFDLKLSDLSYLPKVY